MWFLDAFKMLFLKGERKQTPKMIQVFTLFSLDYPETAVTMGTPDFKGLLLFSLRILPQLMTCGKTAHLAVEFTFHPSNESAAQPQ